MPPLSIKFVPYYLGNSANQAWQCSCNICGAKIVQTSKGLCIKHLLHQGKCLPSSPISPPKPLLLSPQLQGLLTVHGSFPKPKTSLRLQATYYLVWVMHRMLMIASRLFYTCNLYAALWCNDCHNWIKVASTFGEACPKGSRGTKFQACPKGSRGTKFQAPQKLRFKKLQ